MANINETIANVEKLDPELARQIRKYVRDHAYGLVFEHNLPESVRLYTKKAAVGDTVNIRPARGEKEKAENKIPWNVKEIINGQATIENGQDSKKVAVEDLVPIVSYRDVIYPGLKEVDRVERGGKDDPYQVVINAENYHALEMLTYCYAGKVDCIYIDPPYNSRAKDWKYNNDYVDANDKYRHSKWLAFMERRLKLAKQLLNPKDSVLIVTIDEKEYARLGLLLEQLFPEARIQMITDVINPRGTNRAGEFSRVEEYVYICRFGNSTLSNTENNMLGNTDETGKARVWYGFNRPNNPRSSANGQFFPIYIDEKTKRIESVGEPLDINSSIGDFPVIKGLTAVFPINSHGDESIWGAIPKTTRIWAKKGYIRLNNYDKKHKRWTFSYIRSGMQKRIESGEIKVSGLRSDGSLNIQHIDATGEVVPPKSVWYQSSHKSYDFGSTMLKSIISDRGFGFPKSLYSTHDAIRFFVANKPNALIVDFFAGSGTTIHAVNLLNAEDGGHRRCICVTNNEVSADEQNAFIQAGLRPGDKEWEAYGIARYVTWPRIKCSIKGVDVKGEPLQGKYIGSDIPMSDGFAANAIFFDLTYESAWPIRLDNAFDAIAPILWMQAGCKGPIIHRVGKSYLTTDYYGVLFDYGQASKFCEKVKHTPSIKNVFVVTDDQRRYSNMCRRLPGVEVHRLYETFLKTFEICGEGGLD